MDTGSAIQVAHQFGLGSPTSCACFCILQKKSSPLLAEVKNFAATYPAYSAFRGLVSSSSSLQVQYSLNNNTRLYLHLLSGAMSQRCWPACFILLGTLVKFPATDTCSLPTSRQHSAMVMLACANHNQRYHAKILPCQLCVLCSGHAWGVRHSMQLVTWACAQYSMTSSRTLNSSRWGGCHEFLLAFLHYF